MLNVLIERVFIKVVGGTNPHTTHTCASKQLVRFSRGLSLSLATLKPWRLEPARQNAMSHARRRRSVCVCAKVRVEDKSKIEASDKSHLDWGGEAEDMLGEG